jgi:flagellar basal body-associated protein FliL
MECVSWLFPYFHFFYQTFYTYFGPGKSKGKGRKFFLIQCTLIFLLLALVIALIALVMMIYEFLKEKYSYSQKKKE